MQEIAFCILTIYQLKAKNSETKPISIVLGKYFKNNFTVDNVKRTGHKRYVYSFYVDCNTADSFSIDV